MNLISDESTFTDPLTGLYNRTYFLNAARTLMEQAARYGHPLSVMILDVERLKQINDAYGHETGDEVLKQIAENIQQTIRTADVAARFGGDEFIIVMSETDTPQAVQLAKRLQRHAVDTPFSTEESSFHITLAIGVASSSEKKDIPSIEVLLELADRALYQAKESGHGKVGIYDSK